ncbi:MAG TPA: hypothetical protein VGG34_01395 [Opitutaceae bacterium]|jgi:hypothetical protein
MKTNRLIFGALCAFALLLTTGCGALYQPSTPAAATSTGAASSATSPIVLALENPNSIGKTVQAGVQFGATAFLANKNNQQYAGELDAAADALVMLAQSNPALITQADIQAALSAAKVSAATASEIASYSSSGLSLFESNFTTSFPALKPDYAIYLYALANGLYGATGKASNEIPLPVIPWPPTAAAAPTSTPPTS